MYQKAFEVYIWHTLNIAILDNMLSQADNYSNVRNINFIN